MKNNNRFLRILHVLCCLIMATSVCEAVDEEGIPQLVGDGSTENPYQIKNADDLYWFAEHVSQSGNDSSCAILTTDIVVNANVLKKNGELNGDSSDFKTWTPIGTLEQPFTGVFDGAGHTISGLYVDGAEYAGLFGYVFVDNINGEDEKGVVKNVGIEDSYISGTKYIGGVVAYNEGRTLSVYNAGNVTGSGSGCATGGVVGYNVGLVSDAYNAGAVKSSVNDCSTGGVVGLNAGFVFYVYNIGAVSGGANVGGVAGSNSSMISKAYYNTEIFTGNAVGSGNLPNPAAGKTAVELSSLEIVDLVSDKDHVGLSAWVVGSGRVVMSDNKLVYKLPGLKVFSSQPEIVLMQANDQDVFEIGSAQELKWFAEYAGSGAISINAKLTADICLNACRAGESVLDANGTLNGDGANFEQWTPINIASMNTNMSLDGNGHTISGLYFRNADKDSVGFFGSLQGTVSISNLGIEDSYIEGKDNVGVFVGVNDNSDLTITNCFGAGYVKGNGYVAGFVGQSKGNLNIANSYSVSIVNGKDGSAGSFIGNNTLGTIANCFFLNGSSNFGGTQKSADEFHDGTVAVLLHNYDKNDVNGLVWGQDLTNANSLPDFSSVFAGGTLHTLTLHTFEGDTCKYPTEYVSEIGLELPTDLTRENHVFAGWSTKQVSTSMADIVTSIAKGATGAKTFYAQWMKVSEEGVYEIATAVDLYKFAQLVNGGATNINGKLTADICVNACGEGEKSLLEQVAELEAKGELLPESFKQWIPIGTETKKFNGTFDGAGHTISGLYFNQDVSYAGLFGRSTKNSSIKSSIKNVGVVDSYIKGKDYVGGIVGYNGNCTVSNVFSTSTVEGSEYVGGIAGKNDAGTIKNAYNMGAVKGISWVGGIAGVISSSAYINNVYSSGTVSSSESNKIVRGLFEINGIGKHVENAFSNTDFFDGHVISDDKNTYSYDNQKVIGKSSAELAALTIGFVGADFPLLDGGTETPWEAGSGMPVVSNGKLVYKLPKLKIFESQPQPELVLFNVQKGSDGKDYCEITNADDLFKFAQLVNGGATGLNAKLMANICVNACGEGESVLNANGALNGNGSSFTPWTPMNVSSNVTLTFDGNGHTISGLYFNKESSADKGLFGQVTGNVSISNLGVVDFYVKGEDRVGSLAGQVTGKLNIENCFSAGSVEGDTYVGGFVGLNRDNAELNIENSYNESSVNASSGAVGGLVGGNYNYASLTIANSYNVGAVSGNDYVGGLVGDNDSGTLNVSNSYNVGVVTASKTIAGGLVGGDEFGTLNISNSFFVETNGDGDTLGGVVKTPDEFANGEVTDLLNTDQSPIVWVQGKEYPILKDNHVHLYENGFCICGNYEQPVQDENEVYLIANAGNLYWFANFVNQGGDNDSANAVLTSDIVVNENVLNDDGSLVTGVIFREWTPIGLYNYDYSQGDLSISYSGKFDGQGHIVSGLYLNNANKDGVGLFGCISDSSSIQNVRIVDSYFYGKDCVGGVCGVNKAEKIKNCFSSATVIGNSMIGGVCGNMQMSSVENCYNIGLVSGNGQVGGVVGYTFNMGGPLAKNCYSAGIVKEKGTLTNKVFGSVQVGYSQNCYYLADTDDGNGSKTAKQFASGEVAYLLSQGENGEVWGQKIGTDNYPCFYNNKVYASTCAGVACEFTNDINATKIYEEHVFDENGFCTRCGAYEPAENSDGVYQIANAGELYWFADFVNQGGDNAKANAILTNNIVVNTLEFKDGEIVTDNKDYKEWNPIGIDDYYQGIFDGNGHTISGLYFNDLDEWYVGLFASNDGTIQNVGVVGSYFYGHQCVGGVCGNNNIGTISNCYNTSTVSGNNNIGGVSGFNFEGKIENCYNTGAVSGLGFVGEVCGSYNDVTNCYYLSDTDDGNGDGVYGKTAEQFANGTVAKLLYDGENGSIWGQNTSTDTVPNFSGKILFKVTLTAENGTAENGLGEHNKKYEIKATANTGYHFVEWSNGSTEIKDSILVVNDTALVATFEAHSFGKWDTTLVATCTTLGMRSHHCSCGAFENDTIAELPHTIVIDTLIPATCTHFGLTEGSHCSVCKTIFVKQDTIEALGHSFTLYVYNDDATTEADGTKTAVCDHEGCDETDTQVAVGTKLEPTLSEKTEEDKFSIYTFGRSIVVENADADINVYDVTGRLVARREGVHFVAERIEVPNIGIYVVKCGDVVRRVLVK